MSAASVRSILEREDTKWAQQRAEQAAAREQGDATTAREAALEALNKEYAVTFVGDELVVLRITSAGGARRVQYLSPATFKLFEAARKVRDGSRMVAAARLWLEWTQRRQYEGVCFEPGENDTGNRFNLWPGWGVEPSVEGCCDHFYEHVYENVCNRSDELFAHVIGFFAQMVQQPRRKLGTALVLRGAQGAGKTKVGEAVRPLLGASYTLVSHPRLVVGHFNAHLETTLLLQADEGFFAGDHVAEGHLKHLVTSDTLLVERKGFEPVTRPNYLRLLVTSNSDWVVRAGLEERRFAVLDVASHRRGDGAYFAALDAQLRDGGARRLLHDLLTMTLDTAALRRIPQTTALWHQQLQSLSPEMSWLLELLTHGRLPGDRTGSGVALVRDVNADYLAHCERLTVRRRQSEQQLGTWLRAAIPSIERTRVNQPTAGGPARPWAYRFPSLAVARTAFIAQGNARCEWPDDPTAWEADA